jgi:hypothetical protein
MVNSIISQLGFLPPSPEFKVLGITANLELDKYLAENPQLQNKQYMPGQ